MINKRTAHEPSIRIPLVVRYPGLTPPGKPRIVSQMTLTVDLAASIGYLRGGARRRTHGRSWKKSWRWAGQTPRWRTAFCITTTTRSSSPTRRTFGRCTFEWKYIRYPHGDGGPDRRKANLFHLAADPDRATNLDGDPATRARLPIGRRTDSSDRGDGRRGGRDADRSRGQAGAAGREDPLTRLPRGRPRPLQRAAAERITSNSRTRICWMRVAVSIFLPATSVT